MTGIALYGAAERDFRDLPGVYLGNVCGLRSSIELGGGGGLVVRPVCIPGAAYHESFLAPGSGEFVGYALVGRVITGMAAELIVEADGRVIGTHDLTALVPGVPAELVLEGAEARLGETVITVRTACSDDVVPGADLSVMFAGKEGDGMKALEMLGIFGGKLVNRIDEGGEEPPP